MALFKLSGMFVKREKEKEKVMSNIFSNNFCGLSFIGLFSSHGICQNGKILFFFYHFSRDNLFMIKI